MATTDIWEEEADAEPVIGLAVRPEAAYDYDLPPKAARYVDGPKLWFDRVVASIGLVVLSPLIGLIALLVRRTLGSPVLFRQERVGLRGEPFGIVKFRTMRPDRRGSGQPARTLPVPEDRRKTHKTPADPRHTPLGRVLRAWHLDELPQLIHVSRGDMSLVGPRPELVGVVERYEPWQHRRHAVRPGLTGLWQISEAAGSPGEMHKHTALDIEYVDTVSWWNDLKILVLTIPAMHRRRGS